MANYFINIRSNIDQVLPVWSASIQFSASFEQKASYTKKGKGRSVLAGVKKLDETKRRFAITPIDTLSKLRDNETPSSQGDCIRIIEKNSFDLDKVCYPKGLNDLLNKN